MTSEKKDLVVIGRAAWMFLDVELKLGVFLASFLASFLRVSVILHKNECVIIILVGRRRHDALQVYVLVNKLCCWTQERRSYSYKHLKLHSKMFLEASTSTLPCIHFMPLFFLIIAF